MARAVGYTNRILSPQQPHILKGQIRVNWKDTRGRSVWLEDRGRGSCGRETRTARGDGAAVPTALNSQVNIDGDGEGRCAVAVGRSRTRAQSDNVSGGRCAENTEKVEGIGTELTIQYDWIADRLVTIPVRRPDENLTADQWYEEYFSTLYVTAFLYQPY